ncbi:SH3 domain-containing protein [Pseudooceanicola sp.]|uniref:SH3 domain-containing protein n=1 Tax=Pseudooceanicola sp. TaxID=1914328 RepID=UPI0035C6CAB3
MRTFIFLTFAFLAWAFYEMSGGSDFTPTARVTDTPTQAEPAKTPAKPSVQTAAVRAAPRPDPAATETVAEVTRAAYTQPRYDLRAPEKEELAAVDPAVLTSFANVLKKDEPVEAVATETEGSSYVAASTPTDLREVTGNSVNMREGPGTRFSVVDQLQRGDAVEVLDEPGNGWLKLRVAESGQVGWMADFLVSSAE